MRILRTIWIGVVLAGAGNHAYAINKCIGEDGSVSFTDGACPQSAKREEIAVPDRLSRSGSPLRPGEKEMYKRVLSEEKEYYRERDRMREIDHCRHIGHDAQMKIRTLRIRKRELMRQLKRNGKSFGQYYGISRELRDINDQIRDLSSPKC